MRLTSSDVVISIEGEGRPIGSSYYLRLSKVDVYIKLCESALDAATLKALVSGAPSDPLLDATVTAEVSSHEGLLELCPLCAEQDRGVRHAPYD